jgi:thymidine kinase
MSNNPTFTIFCGPMFSSKTSKLLMMLERYKYQHKSVTVFKPAIDDRYSVDQVVSHGGWSSPAICVANGADILGALTAIDGNPDIVAIDEAFMIPGSAEAAIWLYRNGFNVVVSTLDISATGKVFPEIEKMLPWATYIEKCSAICTICGRDAFYTHKKLADDEEIEVGGAEKYEPRCFIHHLAVDMRPKIHPE